MISFNVSRYIPHILIKETFKINPVSSTSFFKVGNLDPEYCYILNFRRQIYINDENTEKLSSAIIINIDNTLHKIFVTEEIITCQYKEESEIQYPKLIYVIKKNATKYIYIFN